MAKKAAQKTTTVPPSHPPQVTPRPPQPQSFPGGMQLPMGTTLQGPPINVFPPELEAKLAEARKNGKYFITVTIGTPTATDPGVISCYQVRSLSFNSDLLMRAWQHICGMIISAGIPNLFTAPQAQPAPVASQPTPND